MSVTGDTAVLGPGSFLSGKLVGGNVTVLGEFEGDLSVTGQLRLGPDSRVRAAVRAGSVEIEGRFEGELHADALSLTERARVSGVFSAARLSVREGAVFEGSVNVPAAAPAGQPAAAGPAMSASVVDTATTMAMAPQAAAPGEPSDGGREISPAVL
jgi:cytoskeletal protein CcmA (bactofilin family)